MTKKSGGISVDEILANPLVPSQLLSVPEWGGNITVRGLTARQRDQIEEIVNVVDAKGRRRFSSVGYRAKVVQMTAFDEENRFQLFKPSQIDLLGDQPGQVISRIVDLVQKLSGMTSENVDELVGNSEAISDEDSSTSSLGTSSSPSVN